MSSAFSLYSKRYFRRLRRTPFTRHKSLFNRRLGLLGSQSSSLKCPEVVPSYFPISLRRNSAVRLHLSYILGRRAFAGTDALFEELSLHWVAREGEC
jgi:hypothetical protein